MDVDAHVQKMSDKERADVLLSLVRLSYDRFDKATDLSWKLRLAVWTAFGVTAGFIISSDKWKPGWFECLLGILLTVGIMVISVFFWSPHAYKRSTRHSRVARHWESEIERLLETSLPKYLQPKQYIGTTGWSADDPLAKWYRHPTYLSSAMITLFLGMLLITALLGKT